MTAKTLSTRHVWAIAVGMVISGQFFGWNYGFEVAGIGGMLIAAIIVTVFYLCFMSSYAELAAMIPKAGGPSAYAEQAFGRTGGFIAGIACLVEFIFAPPAIAIATGAYIHFLWPAIPSHYAAISAFILCLMVNMTGANDIAKFELVVTLLAIVALVIFYAANILPLHHAIIRKPNYATLISHWPAAIPFAIWLYLAIEGVAMTAAQVKHPHTAIPRGFISAIVTVALCSCLTLLFTALHSSDPRAAIDYPLSHTLAELYGMHSWIARSVDILGLFGLLASLNGIMIGYTQQLSSLAERNYVPKFLAVRSTNGTPLWALLIPGGFGLICTASAAISNSLIIVAALGAMVMYGITLLSLFKLRQSAASQLRPYQSWYPWVPGLALVLCIVCLVCLIQYAIMPDRMMLFSWSIHLGYICLVICVVSLIGARRSVST